jgi:hypothetical protein
MLLGGEKEKKRRGRVPDDAALFRLTDRRQEVAGKNTPAVKKAAVKRDAAGTHALALDEHPSG